MDHVKAAHELATLVLAMRGSLSRCRWHEGCPKFATDFQMDDNDDVVGTFCEEHGAIVSQTHWVVPRMVDKRILAASEIAREVLKSNASRDYLQKTKEGKLMSVVVVVQREDKFACVFEPKCGGHPKFPGGGVEVGETTEQSAMREAREEIGVDIQDPKVFLAYPFGDYEVQFVLAKIPENAELKEGDAGPVGWATEAELTTHPIFGESAANGFSFLKYQRNALEVI